MSNTTKVTASDSREALKNDYIELISAFNSEIVEIKRLDAPDGSMCLLSVRVKAPAYIVTSPSDTTPKLCDELTFYVDVKQGYPLTKPHVYFKVDNRLASVNTFSDGTECIDVWNPESSSLRTCIEKTVRDVIHDPSVSNYDSMAYSPLKIWQEDMTARGELPTINPALILADSEIVRRKNMAMPVVKVHEAPVTAVPVASTRGLPTISRS